MQFGAIVSLFAATTVLASAIPQNFPELQADPFTIQDCFDRHYTSILLCDNEDFGENSLNSGDCAFFTTDGDDDTCERALNPNSPALLRDRRTSVLAKNTCFQLGAMNDIVTSFSVTNGCCEFYNGRNCKDLFFTATDRQDGELVGENDQISSFVCNDTC